MKKSLSLPLLVLFAVLVTGMVSFAGDFSSAWVYENGNWHVKGPDGQNLKNCWFCDDAMFSNGQNIWYLLDGDGNMVASPLVRDARGNYYSLETEHNGHYGSLRFQDGRYDDIPMIFSKVHDGTFGALIYKDAINALTEEYGVRDISNIDSNNCYYSSKWLGITGGPQAQSTGGPAAGAEVVADDAFRTIRYTERSKTVLSDSGNTRYFTVPKYNKTGFIYWSDMGGEGIYYPGEIFYFEGNRTGAELRAVFED